MCPVDKNITTSQTSVPQTHGNGEPSPRVPQGNGRAFPWQGTNFDSRQKISTFTYVGAQTQVARFVGKHLYLLIHLVGPFCQLLSLILESPTSEVHTCQLCHEQHLQCMVTMIMNFEVSGSQRLLLSVLNNLKPVTLHVCLHIGTIQFFLCQRAQAVAHRSC